MSSSLCFWLVNFPRLLVVIIEAEQGYVVSDTRSTKGCDSFHEKAYFKEYTKYNKSTYSA
jgi:hypothetical protein